MLLLCSQVSALRQMSNKCEFFLPRFKCEIKNHYESIRPLEALMLLFPTKFKVICICNFVMNYSTAGKNSIVALWGDMFPFPRI